MRIEDDLRRPVWEGRQEGSNHVTSTRHLNHGAAEGNYRLEPTDFLTPERLYERRWALTLLDQVVARLQQELDAAGKPASFELKRTQSGQTLTGVHFNVDGAWVAGVRDNPKAALIDRIDLALFFWLVSYEPSQENVVLRAEDPIAGP